MSASPISPQERIVCLRQRLFDRKDSAAMGRLLEAPGVMAASLAASEGVASWTLRRGLLTRDRLAAIRFAVDDLELLLGRLDLTSLPSETEEHEAQAYLAQYPLNQPGQTGHCELDLDPIMRLGVDGLRRRIEALSDVAHDDQLESYRSFLYALDGLSLMIEHAALTAEAAMPDASSERRAELETIAASCRRLAHEPPATFRDAIQLLWLVTFAVMHADRAWLVAPGHLDRTLALFYDADLAAGRLTTEEALVLIECLYLLVNEYVPDGLAMPVMVGGRDASGRDVTNALSYLSLEALRRTNLIYPTVGVCWHEGTPQDLVDLATQLMGQGYPTPAIFNDGVIQQGLMALGVPADEAARYINSTCVEITPSGASAVWVASPYYNTCGLLLEEVAAQVAAPSATFDGFLSRYRHRLAAAVRTGVGEQNEGRRQRQAHSRRPLQSIFTRDCLVRGRDIEDGGAVYNWIECSFIGLANLADALYVIREEVFNQASLSWAQLKAYLDADFSGSESVRQRFLNAYPKYGQANAAVDALISDTIGFIGETCRQCKVEPDGSAYVPGAFAWVMHERLGRETGATPDGRKAGFPFADGCGPAQGRERRGPTAAVLSVTSWDHSQMMGGLAYNLKFNRALFRSPEAFEGLRGLLLTYMRRGGFEAQVNAIDNEVLKQARLHPEQYRDLIVRIGGYTDYFTRLSPEMQAELILRTEFVDF